MYESAASKATLYSLGNEINLAVISICNLRKRRIQIPLPNANTLTVSSETDVTWHREERKIKRELRCETEFC